MCQGEGANVPLESDKEEDDADGDNGPNRKVKFKIYSVKSPKIIYFHIHFHGFLNWSERFNCLFLLLFALNTIYLQKEHLQQLFHNAVTRQTNIMVDNILGFGIDIPILGLREACKENNNGELCDLFADETYKISQCFLLSTSQVRLLSF